MHKQKTLIVLFAGIWIVSCSFFAASGTASSVNDENSTPSGPDPTFGSAAGRQGELIRDGNLRVMVHGWLTITPLVSPAPEPGQTVITADFSAVNAGGSTLEVFSLRQIWEILDSTGAAFAPDFELSVVSGVNMEASWMKPGEKIRMALIYRMPESSPPASLHFRDSHLPDGSITIALDAQPGIADPPETIEGEIPPTMLSAGEQIRRGNWEVEALGARSSQPCKNTGLRSSFNCSMFPSDFQVVAVDLVMKNVSGKTQMSIIGGMLWLQDPTGRRFYGSSKGANAAGQSVASGAELRITVEFLVWPDVSVLWLAFRDPYGDDPNSGGFTCVPLPSMGAG